MNIVFSDDSKNLSAQLVSLPDWWVGKRKVVLGWNMKFVGSEFLEITLLKA